MTTQILSNDTDILQDTDIRETPEGPSLRHIVNPPSNLHIWRLGMTAQDIVDVARVNGVEITALCGAKFIPTKNPEDVDKTCDTCMDIASIMMSNPPEGD